MPDDGYYHPPTLIQDVETSDTLMRNIWPRLVSTTFRTPSEAVSLANNTRYGLPHRFGENINLALGSPETEAGVVWVTNKFL